MKPTSQYQKTLQSYSLDTLLKIRDHLEMEFLAGRLDSKGAKKLVDCRQVIVDKTEQSKEVRNG